jgi:hypothetical protein
MSTSRLLNLAVLLLLLSASFPDKLVAQSGNKIQHVLLISVDGMHSLDFPTAQEGYPHSATSPTARTSPLSPQPAFATCKL